MTKMKALGMALCVAGCAGPYVETAGGKFAASREVVDPTRPLAVTVHEARDGSRETDEERREKAAERKRVEAEAKVDVCRDQQADSLATRSESWSKQFRIYEELADESKIPLGSDALQYVDTSSRIVIERISEVPKVIAATDGTRDVRLDLDPVGFDVDVVIVGSSDAVTPGTSGCRRRVPVPGLQDIGGYDRGHIEPGCHDVVYPAYTRPGPIEKSAQFIIPPWTFKPGDSVQIQLEGRVIGQEQVTLPLTDKSTIESAGKTLGVDRAPIVGNAFRVKLDSVTEDGKKQGSLPVVATATRTICATPFTVSFRMLNYSSIVPYEDRNGAAIPLLQVNGRSDNRNDVYFAFKELQPERSADLFHGAIAMTATAIDRDQKTRTIGLATNASRPTLEHLNDGETIVINLARKIKSDDGKPSEVPIKRYTFTAVAAGLHAAASGERKANIATSSALFMLLKHSDQHYGFAQTLSYTIANKTLRPSFWDDAGVGVHVSVLARDKDSGAMDDKPVALGIGAHLALGANTVHLGAGYDVINHGPYVILGLSIPDLFDFLKAQSVTAH